MKLGTTLSHRHLDMLSISDEEAFSEIKNSGIKYLRLGCYWDEIEKEKNNFDFSRIKKLLDFCEEEKIQVLLTVGCKAPRLPEFYFPFWLKNPFNFEKNKFLLFNFVKKSIEELKIYKCIFSWQIENEPLDKFFMTVVPDNIVFEEIRICRELDKRPIHINFWGNDLIERGVYPKTLDKADSIGVDFYFYIRGMWKDDKVLEQEKLKKIFGELQKTKKEIWITELQAEPWAFHPFEFTFVKFYEKFLRKNPKLFLYTTNIVDTKKNSKSIDLNKLKEIYAEVTNAGFQNIFFWGFEYWLWRKKKFGDESFLEFFKSIPNTDV